MKGKMERIANFVIICPAFFQIISERGKWHPFPKNDLFLARKAMKNMFLADFY